jgi:hypothetical protein
MFVAALYSCSRSSVHLESSRHARYAIDETKYKHNQFNIKSSSSPIWKNVSKEYNRPRAIFFRARLARLGWSNTYSSELLLFSTCET